MKIPNLFFGIILALISVGCSESGADVPTSLTGTIYEGIWRSDDGFTGGNMTVTFFGTATTVTYDGSPCQGDADGDYTYDDGDVLASVFGPESEIAIDARATGSRIRGGYLVTAGTCGVGDTGTVDLVLVGILPATAGGGRQQLIAEEIVVVDGEVVGRARLWR